MGKRKQTRVSEEKEEQEHQEDVNASSSSTEKSLYEVLPFETIVVLVCPNYSIVISVWLPDNRCLFNSLLSFFPCLMVA